MTRLGGLLVRRECWTLSLPGKLLVVSLAGISAFSGIFEAYPFLAVNHPIPANVLVVEGWIRTYTLSQVADEFKRGHYQRLLFVRSLDIDEYEYETGRATLLKYGVPADSLDTLYYPVVRKDRTYHTALAVKNWLAKHELSLASVNVVTVGPHARRSRLTFEKTFGTPVGIIALDDEAYDSRHWWRTSEGVREVIGETIAYTYAKFFFVWN